MFKTPAVAVEYDRRGERVLKVFGDAYEARRFYKMKLLGGKNPAVKKVEDK